MTATLNHKILPYLLSTLLVLATMPAPAHTLLMYQEQPAPSSSGSSGYSGQGAPMSAQELQSLVAPIALYPDALVAQILSAATYPDQIAVANAWMQQNKNLTGSALGQAVNGQSWDPSVKALTQFPSVLNNLAQNMVWTSQLGEAYHNQSSDVMAAIQTLRAQAKAAGNLKSGAQITVVQQSPQTIVIQPTNPQVVYVPEYNPTVIYGTPYVTPGYSTGDMVATSLLSFGAGMAVGAMMSGGCCGWGWSNWNCNWYHGGGAYYGNHPYYGNDAWHGGYYDGNHPYNGYNNGYHPNGYNASGYHPNNHNSGYDHTGNNTYNRNTNVSGNTVNANRNDASNSWNKSGGGWESSDAARGYGSEDTGSHATAFSGYGDHSGSSFGSGGWGDRSASSRGWGSQGGGGGWGGGHGGGGGGGRR